MSEPLCTDLTLSIWREDASKDKEQIRVKLANELEMLEVEVCQEINVTTQQSRRYHIKEAVIIVLRQAVSEAFQVGMISDSLGVWKITRPTGSAPKSDGAGIEIDLNDSLL